MILSTFLIMGQNPVIFEHKEGSTFCTILVLRISFTMKLLQQCGKETLPCCIAVFVYASDIRQANVKASLQYFFLFYFLAFAVDQMPRHR